MCNLWITRSAHHGVSITGLYIGLMTKFKDFLEFQEPQDELFELYLYIQAQH